MIRHIVATDSKRGIAKDGIQPWKLPSDEAYFSDMTKKFGGRILMGSTTFKVIGRPLPGRENFVATKDPNFSAEGVIIVNDIRTFLETQEDIWVIGGAQIYAATLALANELYVTEIDYDFQCDTFYPEFSRLFTTFHEGELQSENGLDFRYNIYVPKV